MSNKILAPKVETQHLRNLFFFFGLAILAFAPRTPDLERQLRISNGNYGVLVSLGVVGALIAFFLGGQLLHRMGSRSFLIFSSIGMYGSLAIIAQIHRPIFFVLTNIACAISFNFYAIAIHGHALHRQSINPELTLPRLHGAWSIGALLTVAIAFAVTSQLSLAWHIEILMAICALGTFYSIHRISPVLARASRESDPDSSVKIRAIWELFRSDKLIGIAYVFSVMTEFSTNDWGTLQAHQEIRASTTLSILPYLLFMVGMIAGRLGIRKLVLRWSERGLIRTFTFAGGLTFIILMEAAKALTSHHFVLAFTAENIAFLAGGLGGSFMAGTIMQIANHRTTAPGSLVFAQIQLVTAILSFGIKLIVTWIVDLTSITDALVLPGILMLCVSLFPGLGSKEIRGA